ncbi:hypothetical protein EPH_0046790 [Eimeria praecox]|uniref:Transmembrane protein n=1 Tax=Eimeria praecox TaxID=51316 RepID=U6HAV2_9EIME|nr:hypothetical protein EPH_0046790 [Eimeria praecox]
MAVGEGFAGMQLRGGQLGNSLPEDAAVLRHGNEIAGGPSFFTRQKLLRGGSLGTSQLGSYRMAALATFACVAAAVLLITLCTRAQKRAMAERGEGRHMSDTDESESTLVSRCASPPSESTYSAGDANVQPDGSLLGAADEGAQMQLIRTVDDSITEGAVGIMKSLQSPFHSPSTSYSGEAARQDLQPAGGLLQLLLSDSTGSARPALWVPQAGENQPYTGSVAQRVLPQHGEAHVATPCRGSPFTYLGSAHASPSNRFYPGCADNTDLLDYGGDVFPSTSADRADSAVSVEAWLEKDEHQQHGARSAQQAVPGESHSPVGFPAIFETTREHNFYRIPHVLPGQILRPMNFARASGITSGIREANPLLRQARNLLVRPSITPQQLETLTDLAERLAAHALRYQRQSMHGRPAGAAVIKLGIRFLIMDVILCTLQLLGQRPAGPWWLEITEAVSHSPPIMDGRATLTAQRRYNVALAFGLSQALAGLKLGIRPSEAEVVRLKRMLFCNKRSPKYFLTCNYDEWRHDDRSS